jgi:2-polyprenyl-3-methyl-5-hydroxy-6-metoxy-1,4-benzoquinol methylase
LAVFVGEAHMSYSDFVKLYAVDTKKTPEALLAQAPLSFPMSTLERGEKFALNVEKLVTMPVSSLRVLDVGCAYGGHSLALSKRGAKVVGVDVSTRFIDYARANASGVDDRVNFQVFDASGLKIRQTYPKGSFNLVIMNDVLEHIYDTASSCSRSRMAIRRALCCRKVTARSSL